MSAEEDAVDLEMVRGFVRVDDMPGLELYLAGVYAEPGTDRAVEAANTRRLVLLRDRLDVIATTRGGNRSPARINENTIRNLEDDVTMAELQAMRGAMPGESVRVDDPAPCREPTLTAEEAGYLLALGEGKKPSEIAAAKGFSDARQVQKVIRRAREKLGCETTEQAVLWAYRNGEFAWFREQPKPPRRKNRTKAEIEAEKVELERRRMRRDGEFNRRGLRGSDDEKA